MAVERDIIHKSGAWFSYKDQRIAQGRDNTRIYLREHPEVTDEIDAIIRAELFKTGIAPASEGMQETADNPEDEASDEELLSLLEQEEAGSET